MSERDEYVAEINRRLKEKGFAPGELQAALRGLSGDHLAPFTTQEIELGLLDAFSNMGGATVWCGDGSSCAVQIVEHQIALAESALTGAEEEIERLKAENASLLGSLRESREVNEVRREYAAFRRDADLTLAECHRTEDRLHSAIAAAEQRNTALEGALREAWGHLYKMHDLAQLHVFDIEEIACHGDAEEKARYKQVSADYNAAEHFIGTWRAALHDEERSAPGGEDGKQGSGRDHGREAFD